MDDVAEILQLSNTGVSFTDLGVTETAILGGDGADWIMGCDDDDVISGEAGNDVPMGGDGSDDLDGSGGNDTFFGGDGSDILVGGSGNDTVVFTGDLSDYSVSYEAVTQVFRVTGKVGSESTDIESQFKTFTFNGKDYTAAEMETEAARQANSVLGQASVKSGGTVGENSAAGTVVAVLQATNADGDALTFELTDVGGAAVLDCNFEIVGNEVRVKTGADLDIESAESFDVFVTSSDTFKTSAPQRITLSVTDFAETIIQTAGDDTFVDSGVAQFQIEGRTGNDFLSTGTAVGGDGNDRLYGHSTGTNNEIDANNLSGRGGADLLHGADGIDLLSVRDGDDTLFGLGGDDTLEGGFGSDTMQGGDGADARMLSAS
jgi:Ca2+-binding RTX toxin-like protein